VKLTKSPQGQALLGWLMGVYLRLMLHTIRWRRIGLDAVEPALAADQGMIGLIWHGRIPISLGSAPQWWRKRTAIIISPSADGEITAKAMGLSGYHAIRGSSAKKGDSAKARAVVAAFRESLDWVAGGGALVISPDGPRGPNEVIAPGAVQIARRTGCPVFLMGAAVSPHILLRKSWDKAMLGLPFGRGVMIWVGPLYAPPDADDAGVQALVADWSAKLSAATREAETMVLGRALIPSPGDET